MCVLCQLFADWKTSQQTSDTARFPLIYTLPVSLKFRSFFPPPLGIHGWLFSLETGQISSCILEPSGEFERWLFTFPARWLAWILLKPQSEHRAGCDEGITSSEATHCSDDGWDQSDFVWPSLVLLLLLVQLLWNNSSLDIQAVVLKCGIMFWCADLLL